MLLILEWELDIIFSCGDFFLTTPKFWSILVTKMFFVFSLRVFIHFWRLHPTFFRNILNFVKMKKFLNFNGLKYKFQKHFLKGNQKYINQNRIPSFLVGKRQSFNFFLTIFEKCKIFLKNLEYKRQKLIKTRSSGLIWIFSSYLTKSWKFSKNF